MSLAHQALDLLRACADASYSISDALLYAPAKVLDTVAARLEGVLSKADVVLATLKSRLRDVEHTNDQAVSLLSMPGHAW